MRILAVDDEPRLTRLITLLLAGHGHDVKASHSGEDALERLNNEQFDIVLSNVGLGSGMNGWELDRIVRKRWPNLRFAFATGWGAQFDEATARAAGVDTVLAKPYSGDDLARTVGLLAGGRVVDTR